MSSNMITENNEINKLDFRKYIQVLIHFMCIYFLHFSLLYQRELKEEVAFCSPYSQSDLRNLKT